MDMYQKRKIRKEKNVNKQEEISDNKMNINCDVGINGKHAVSTEISKFL